MNIDNMTIGELKEIKNFLQMPVNESVHPYNIGKNYLVRTVTMTLFGQLVAVHQQELVLRDAAWIADSGRWANALTDGSFDEVEPFPDGEMIVGRGAIVDAVELALPLERKQK